MTRSVPPPYLSGGRTRHSWWPLFWAVLILLTTGVALTFILIAGEHA